MKRKDRRETKQKTRCEKIEAKRCEKIEAKRCEKIEVKQSERTRKPIYWFHETKRKGSETVSVSHRFASMQKK